MQQGKQTSTLYQRMQKVRFVITDVDGTLTDGGMYYGVAGEVMKLFNTRDGMGFTLLHRAGVETAIMTSEDTEIVASRARKLKVAHVFLGVRNKKEEFTKFCLQHNISAEECAYIGDDINDEWPMRLSGVSACPSDAVETIRRCADYVCSVPGGKGAFREFAELLLTARGASVTLPESF